MDVTLRELLQSSGVLAEVAAHANLSVPVRGVTADSRKVSPGSVFVAVSGQRHRGADFVPAAVAAGAVAVVADATLDCGGAVLLKVSDVRAALGQLASAWHGHPSRQLHVVGVTGTNGKTTTTGLIAQLCHAAGLRSAAIGTIGVWTPEGVRPGSMTTPDAESLQALLAQLRDEGVTHVAMEVSSHALDQQRVAGVQFAATAWTNLSRDHLDYHGTEQAYGEAKARLFREFSAKAAFANGDDPVVRQVWEEGRAEAWSMGTHPAAEHQLRDLRCDADGLRATLHSPGRAPLPLEARLVGRHNAENLCAAVLVVRSLGIADAVLSRAIPLLTAPRGRLQPVDNTLGALVVVDYAHTPDALDKVLGALRPLASATGKLVVVFGCGGDRDRGKRSVMGALACRHADLCLLTSDNPRTEQPEAILAEIEAGCAQTGAARLERLTPATLASLDGRSAWLVEADREAAIRRAIGVLAPGDVLCIAGKGHELTQTIGTEVRPFDDAEVAARWLAVCAAEGARSEGWSFRGSEALAACGGTLEVAGTRAATALCTDSRQLGRDALFVALPGDRFDGGSFAAEAIRLGAAGIVCTPAWAAEVRAAAAETDCWLLATPDPLVALGALTLAHRRRFTPLVVGVTGSNGKTTTKELIALALSPAGGVLATQGNFNNRIGVPLTVARLGPEHGVAVVEMGMSEPGEIALLAAMAEPQIGVITSISEAHMAGLGSLEAIAAEKASLVRALSPEGIALLPADEPLLDAVANALPCRVIRFGRHAGDVRLAGPVTVDGLTQRFEADVGGTRVTVALPGLGVHLAHNALAALAVAWAAGVDLQAAAAALGRYAPVGQRMLPSRIGPWLVLEDCYNANPRSTETALDTLATLPRPHVAVLGSMLELGPTERELHARVGAHAATTGCDLLVAVGEFAADYARGASTAGLAAVETTSDPHAAAQAVAAVAPQGGTVLVKGSRGARMERVVGALRGLAETVGGLAETVTATQAPPAPSPGRV
jgi:murE/murF fusion protein